MGKNGRLLEWFSSLGCLAVRWSRILIEPMGNDRMMTRNGAMWSNWVFFHSKTLSGQRSDPRSIVGLGRSFRNLFSRNGRRWCKWWPPFDKPCTWGQTRTSRSRNSVIRAFFSGIPRSPLKLSPTLLIRVSGQPVNAVLGAKQRGDCEQRSHETEFCPGVEQWSRTPDSMIQNCR